MPASFAEEYRVSNAEGSSTPGCEANNECFVPASLTINVGDMVIWDNVDNAAHTIISGVLAEGGPDGIFDSGLVSPGTEFSHTFDDEGTFPYFCLVHPWMSGEVVVEAHSSLMYDDNVMAYDSGVSVMNTDGVLHTIPLDKIRFGGVPRDGIPSIDNPKFVTAADADFMSGSDVVMGLAIDGEVKAYPLIILVWHEIVNDEIGDIPVAVTYCPLCYTSQVFGRVIDYEPVEFGVSGLLYQSNLLMYDRYTESYWSQALGMAVRGPLSGQQLSLIPFDLITWADWQSIHPDTLILSTDTGHARAYSVDPYGNYYTTPGIYFPIDNHDERLPQKEIIMGLGYDGVYKAYRQTDIENEIVINDRVGSRDVLMLSLYQENARAFDRTVGNQTLEFRFENGSIMDTGSGSEWDYNGTAVSGIFNGTQLIRLPIEPGFWFEWATFHNSTLIYEGQ